jgi:hypothetical protein
MWCNLLRWQYMAVCALKGTADSGDRLFVEYERLLTSPFSQVGRLARFLDDRCGTTSTARTLEVMATIPDDQLWRHRATRVRGQDELTPAQRDLYLVQRRLAGDHTGVGTGRFEMPPGWRQAVTAEEARSKLGSP